MNHSALTPVFTALRMALHALVVGLGLFVVLRAVFGTAEAGAPAGTAAGAAVVIAIGCLFLATYAAGSMLHGRWGIPVLLVPWTLILAIEWLALATLTVDATYLVFPLFFLFLHLLPRPWNVAAVLVSVAAAIGTLVMHGGWSIGGVVGPLVGAGVAVAIGLGYAALFREARERDELIADLLAARTRLATTEREAGVLAERARLAREIHDTLAQGLSSIQLLLHAVERADAAHPAIEHVRLARATAATNLAEARRFIRELTPPALEEQGIEGALRRLGATTTRATGIRVNVRVSGDAVPVPMPIETALLRIAQGSIANVTQHAAAHGAELTLSYMDDVVSLDIVDDGRGFDPSAVAARGGRGESFGLAAMRQRVARLGGTVAIESSVGGGTAVAVSFPLPEDEGAPAEEEDA